MCYRQGERQSRCTQLPNVAAKNIGDKICFLLLTPEQVCHPMCLPEH